MTSPARLFAALNPPFEQQWAKDNGGDKLTIKQSHAGSSKQALAILQGLKADVVTYNQVTDVQILHDKRLIPADWQSRLPNNSSPFYSTMASSGVRATRRISTPERPGTL